MSRPARPIIERFWNHVQVDEESGCWLWTSFLDKDGYGVFFTTRGGEQRGHRFAYTHFVGPIPEGLVIDHLCRVRNCVNPAHLEPVTNRENILRGYLPWANRTHCSYGHEFTPENTYRVGKHHGRKCRRCHADRERARRAARRVAA